MTAETVIIGIDTVGALVTLIALAGLLARTGRLTPVARGLLAGILGLGLGWGGSNILEWTRLFPPADIAETFLNPLLPVLWLFLFIVVPEQEARRRLRRNVERLSALHRLAVGLIPSRNTQTLMDEVVEQASQLLELPVVAILTPDDSDKRLRVRASKGLPPEEADQIAFDLPDSMAGRALLRRRPTQTEVPGRDLAEPTVPLAEAYGLTNVIAVPLLTQDDAVGVLSAGRAGNRRFDDGEIRLLQTLCAHAAVSIDSARLLGRVTESEAKYRAIVENAQAAIIVVNPYRHVLFWNRGAERLFGWTAQEVRDHHVEFIYPEDRRGEVIRHILPALQRDGVWSGEFPCLRKDGTEFTGFLNLSRVFDASGTTICTLGILSDVTERVRLRQQLVHAQKMETLGTLAGGIAHDFNNLLSAILGSAGLLRADLPEGSENHESAVSIEQAARRGTELVEQLMALSRKEPTRAEPLNLNDIVEEAVALLRRTLPGTIEIVTRLHPHLRTVRGDAGQMHQVLMNLAVNARDAMDNRGTLTIATENVRLDGDELLGRPLGGGAGVGLNVSDTGCGIPPEDQRRVFEPFVTSKQEGGGTGLGLSTVYAIINRHGGQITVDSTPDRGTTFRIVLPAG